MEICRLGQCKPLVLHRQKRGSWPLAQWNIKGKWKACRFEMLYSLLLSASLRVSSPGHCHGSAPIAVTFHIWRQYLHKTCHTRAVALVLTFLTKRRTYGKIIIKRQTRSLFFRTSVCFHTTLLKIAEPRQKWIVKRTDTWRPETYPKSFYSWEILSS